MAASTRAQPIWLKLSATAPLSLWINRCVIELFCAQVFGIRKGRPFDPQRRLSTIRVINLAGGVSRRTHHAANRRAAHSDFSRQLLLRRIRVRRHLPRYFRPHFRRQARPAHGFALPLQCNSVGIRHPPHRRVNYIAERHPQPQGHVDGIGFGLLCDGPGLKARQAVRGQRAVSLSRPSRGPTLLATCQ